MDYFLYVIKETIQMPFFWLVLSVCILCISLIYFKFSTSVKFLLITLLWFISITPLGASLWLGSLMIDDSPSNECIEGTINSMIILPGGLSWRLNENKLSIWSIKRADRAIELLKDNMHIQILLPGGLGKGRNSEAGLLKTYIQNNLSIVDIQIAEGSENTYDNLETIKPMLKKNSRYYLVTSYWHMLRAKRVAEKLSILVCPVATRFEMNWSIIPSLEAHWQTKAAIHEWFGLAWYGIKGKT